MRCGGAGQQRGHNVLSDYMQYIPQVAVSDDDAPYVHPSDAVQGVCPWNDCKRKGICAECIFPRGLDGLACHRNVRQHQTFCEGVLPFPQGRMHGDRGKCHQCLFRGGGHSSDTSEAIAAQARASSRRDDIGRQGYRQGAVRPLPPEERHHTRTAELDFPSCSGLPAGPGAVMGVEETWPASVDGCLKKSLYLQVA